MKKRMILTILVSVMLAINIMPPRKEGLNIITGSISCTGELNCWHEIGHAADTYNFWQWTSFNISFHNTVDDFILQCNNAEVNMFDIPYCNFIVGYPGIGDTPYKLAHWSDVDFWLGGWGGYLEAYADILSCAGGIVNRIPQQFKEFYDQEIIDNLSKKYGVASIDISRCIIRR